MQSINIVLIFGSAPEVTEIRQWDFSHFKNCIAINNAWQVRPDWDYLIFPEDFPEDRQPKLPIAADQRLITANEFVFHQNRYGGFIYAGGTMAFTAGYWALGALKPEIIAYVGCDMVYSADLSKTSHFYGRGSPDPLRNDITLQSLEAKSNRLMALANMQECAVVNLSSLPESRLTFPRIPFSELKEFSEFKKFLSEQKQSLSHEKISQALAAEESLGYFVPSGRYWETSQNFDPIKLRMIDDMWIDTLKSSVMR
jgi:hypothetical protein